MAYLSCLYPIIVPGIRHTAHVAYNCTFENSRQALMCLLRQLHARSQVQDLTTLQVVGSEPHIDKL